MRRELQLRASQARTIHGSRSLLAQADLQVRELGLRLDESCSGLRRYGYRYLDALPRSRFAVQLSESPSVRG